MGLFLRPCVWLACIIGGVGKYKKKELGSNGLIFELSGGRKVKGDEGRAGLSYAQNISMC